MFGFSRCSRSAWWSVLCATTFGMAGATAAQTPSISGARSVIYTCVSADGRRFTSDRPIAECANREQRVLNSDGSLRHVVPPQMSAEERAEKDARDRKAELDRLAQQDAVRRDRNLMLRYPDQPAHQKAREAALDTVRMAMRTSEQRVKDLGAERKPLVEEAEFYKNKPLPAKLKQQLDANDAATEAQRNAIQNQQAELERVNRLYDTELARLRKLWAGAAPGTLAEAGNGKPRR
jgi:hypothetical protein